MSELVGPVLRMSDDIDGIVAAIRDDNPDREVTVTDRGAYVRIEAAGFLRVTRESVARYLGILAATMSRTDDAGRHYEQALVVNERIGARPWLAHTQEDYARLLLNRGEPGDTEKARELLAKAVATYRELGMEGHATTAAAR